MLFGVVIFFEVVFYVLGGIADFMDACQHLAVMILYRPGTSTDINH